MFWIALQVLECTAVFGRHHIFPHVYLSYDWDTERMNLSKKKTPISTRVWQAAARGAQTKDFRLLLQCPVRKRGCFSGVACGTDQWCADSKITVCVGDVAGARWIMSHLCCGTVKAKKWWRCWQQSRQAQRGEGFAHSETEKSSFA